MSLRGQVEHFPLETILQLLSGTGKTGQLEVRGDTQTGVLGFGSGRLVSAEAGDDAGETALGALFAVQSGEFEFVHWNDAPAANLSGDLDQLLDRAVIERDRLIGMREVIPDDRMRFRLSERAADQGEIKLRPEQWRALLSVNGERDVRGIAQHLRIGRLAALGQMAELVRSGIIDTIDPPEEAPEPPPAETPRDETPSPIAAHALPARSPEPPSATPTPASAPAPSPLDEPAPAEDDRLAALSGVFGPAEPAPAPAQWDPPPPPPVRADERSGLSLGERTRADAAAPPPTRPAPAFTPGPAFTTPSGEPLTSGEAPPAADTADEAEPRRGGLFGFLNRSEPAAASATPAPAGAPVVRGSITASFSRAGQLAWFANALLAEYANGQYGAGKVDDRIANLLMRVDEQADPIDRPLPIMDDRIDVQALEAEDLPEEQVVPYLGVLTGQIYEDAERVFGRDKARRGFKAAQQSVFGDNANALRALDPAGRLPKV